MSTTLQPVSDPVQAHNLWKAGLLVNRDGYSWRCYEARIDPDEYSHPDSPSFRETRYDWFICLEE